MIRLYTQADVADMLEVSRAAVNTHMARGVAYPTPAAWIVHRLTGGGERKVPLWDDNGLEEWRKCMRDKGTRERQVLANRRAKLELELKSVRNRMNKLPKDAK